MQLDIELRSRLAASVLEALASAAPASEVGLQGSLAEHREDQFSDIDIFWEISDDRFDSCLDRIADVLSGVRPLESLRWDPVLANSNKHRMIFARFEDVPLFWRLDLEVFARSINRDKDHDLNNPLARTEEWSRTESALANAVAAVKQHLRGNDDVAMQLLARAYQRVGLCTPNLEKRDLILRLIDKGTRRGPRWRIGLKSSFESLFEVNMR